MASVEFISKTKLYWRKIEGCYREFGFIETTRRMIGELIRSLKQSEVGLDISLVTKDLAIGAAPRSFHSINRLRDLGFRHVIDLRAERIRTDTLMNAADFLVKWIPRYDDWGPSHQNYIKNLR